MQRRAFLRNAAVLGAGLAAIPYASQALAASGPVAEWHVVAKGESLTSIAAARAVSVEALSEIEIGPRWMKQLHGGHVASLAYNENSLGVCLVGNFERQRPTERQIAALIELVGHLKDDLLVGKPRLFLHRDVQGERTLCPGRHFPARRVHRLFDSAHTPP